MCEATRDGHPICDCKITHEFIIRAPLGIAKAELCTSHKLQIQKEHPTWVILTELPR